MSHREARLLATLRYKADLISDKALALAEEERVIKRYLVGLAQPTTGL
jgi:hypothetical protein